MYELPKQLLDRILDMARVLMDRDMMGYQGDRLHEKSRARLLEDLNGCYWKRTDLSPKVKDDLRDLYNDVAKMKKVQPDRPSHPSTPNKRPSRDERRNKLLDIKRRQQQRRQGSPEVSDMDLKKELIKLGTVTPELRDDIRPILDTIAGDDRKVQAASASSSLTTAVEQYLAKIVKMMDGMIRKTPRIELRLTALTSEYGGYVFGVIEGRSKYIGDITLKYDGDMIHASSPGIKDGRGFKIKLSPDQAAKSLAKDIMIEITDLLL